MIFGDVYDCPQCGRSGYYKPPFNTPDECMSCRWSREHPTKSLPTAQAARTITKYIYKLRAERRLYPELYAEELARKLLH